MDLYRIIKDLYEEKKRLDALIAALEALPAMKTMGSAERRAIEKALKRRERGWKGAAPGKALKESSDRAVTR